jgi:hypothetical protein
MHDFVARYSYPHLEIGDVRIVDCDDGKFMNHSDQPNTDFTVFDKGFALTDIAVGEEITCNYYEFDPGFRGFGQRGLEVPIGALQTAGFLSAARTRA